MYLGMWICVFLLKEKNRSGRRGPDRRGGLVVQESLLGGGQSWDVDYLCLLAPITASRVSLALPTLLERCRSGGLGSRSLAVGVNWACCFGLRHLDLHT